MGVEHVYSGSALNAVGADGAVPLPPFVRRVVESGAGTGSVMVGVHETDPCLTVYEMRDAGDLQAELERRRLRDESLGAPALDHHARARRLFGFVEDAAIEDGLLLLPALMRARGRIGAAALFVGTGRGFEIWNPELAREASDEGLRELAAFRMGETKQSFDSERNER